MKKLIITEEQFGRLVNFLSETNKNNENVKKERKQRIADELRSEFNETIKSLKVCDDLYILCSKIDKKEKLVEGSKTIIVLRVTATNKKGIRFKALRVIGQGSPIEKNKIYDVHYSDFFNIADDGILLKFYLPDSDGKFITQSDFQIYKAVSNNGDCKRNYSEPTQVAAELNDIWLKSIDKLLQKSEYQKGLFGMNNIFFFPKGFQAMDDILAKYGLKVNKYKSKGNTVEFKILSKPNFQAGLKKDAIVKGTIDYKHNIIVNKLYFKVPDDEKIIEGNKLKVSVYSITSKSEKELGYLDILILKSEIDSPKIEKEMKQGEENVKKKKDDNNKQNVLDKLSSLNYDIYHFLIKIRNTKTLSDKDYEKFKNGVDKLEKEVEAAKNVIDYKDYKAYLDTVKNYKSKKEYNK